MGIQATMTGYYVTRRYKKWDAFTDRDGKDVAAGESLSVFVYTPTDDDLCEIKVPTELLPEFMAATAGTTFGTVVEVTVGDKTYGKYKGLGIAAPAVAA